MLRCSSMLVGRPFSTSGIVLYAAFMMISIAVLHPLRAIGNSMSACSWRTDKVSSRLPLNSVTLRSMLCCSSCLPAARALGWLPSASG